MSWEEDDSLVEGGSELAIFGIKAKAVELGLMKRRCGSQPGCCLHI